MEDINKEIPKLTIKNWAEDDKPREKMVAKGKAALSDAELLTILISSGTKKYTALDIAKILLQKCNNDINELAKLTLEDLTTIDGIGTARAVTIIAAIELGRRRKPDTNENILNVDTPEKAYQIIKAELMDIAHEEFWIMLLNPHNKFLNKVRISTGGTSQTTVDTKILFQNVLSQKKCSKIILIHNHPNGSIRPSQNDITITKKIIEASKLLDIEVVDHIIFSDSEFFSFKEKNYM
ncbi:MAG: DNA repair protein RadC [Chitinophagaceae bacterium]|nr:DNA repair protein RadC [Chitinophagaceae bacterium]